MKTETELKNKCTPKFYLWLMELSGFDYMDQMDFTEQDLHDKYFFPLLIHRAVEGWNNQNLHSTRFIVINDNCVARSVKLKDMRYYTFCDNFYQPQSLTQAEMAMLDCLIDIFEEVR